eukprot:6478041-Amphidinium_carterae.1
MLLTPRLVSGLYAVLGPDGEDRGQLCGCIVCGSYPATRSRNTARECKVVQRGGLWVEGKGATGSDEKRYASSDEVTFGALASAGSGLSIGMPGRLICYRPRLSLRLLKI